MADEWHVLSLNEAGVALIDCDHRTPPASDRGYPYIAIPQITEGRLNLSAVRRITREHFQDWTRKAKPKPYDVILSRRCNPGETAVVPAGLECALGQNLVLLRADGKRVFPPFLRWLVRGPEWWNEIGKFINVGAVFDSLRCADIPNFHLSIPSVSEQEVIASILGALDDKIELNRRMNETLEAMARAIFKSWFVDFDPVRAKMEGRKPTGMDADTAALFPDSFQDSPLGKIPMGWSVTPLPEAIEVNPRYSLQRSAEAPYIEMKDLPTTAARVFGSRRRPLAAGSKFTNGDVLVARITPCLENGKTAFVDCLEDGQVGWGSTEFIVLRSKPPLPVEYAYFLARSENFRAHAIQNMTGSSGRQRVPEDCFDQYSLVCPPSAIAAKFGSVAESIMHALKANDEQSATLAAIRDALLPKLLSGEVRVKETEGIAGSTR